MHDKHDLSHGPESIPAEPQLINKIQLARAVGVSVRTIDTWIQRKWIPSIPISPRCRRFRLSAVLAVLHRYETEAVERPEPAGTEPREEREENAGKGGRP